MTFQLRAATPQDARHMASLVDLASEGLANSIWCGMKKPNEAAIDVGTRLALRDNADFSWRNAKVAEVDGEVAGMLLINNPRHEPEPIDSVLHPSLRPIAKLKNMALGTKFLGVVATYEKFRGHGVAQHLFKSVETDPEKVGMSMIILDGNKKMLEYCLKLGFRDVAQVPLIKVNWDTDNTTWHLLRKP